MNLRKPKPFRLRLAALCAAVGLLAVVSSAAAVVYVYKNGFNTRSGYKEITQTGGGNACDKGFVKESTSMRIEVEGREFCEYAPPVAGDRDQPDHEIIARGRILKDTPRNVREHSFLGVRVRVGNGSYYEFRVNPGLRDFKLNREPGGAGLPIADGTGQIEKLSEDNTLRLRVTGDKVTAFVNGEPVATYNDPQIGKVTGRRVAFGIGNSKSSQAGPIGLFESVRVGVPTP